LPINQPLEIVARENRWCRVRLVASTGSTDAAQEGYVNCAFLKDKKLDFATLETEAARLFLELHRENLTPSEEARILEALFTQIERHFALSPSLYAYNDYRALLRDAQRRGSENPEFQLPAREKKQAAMLRELSRQTWEGDFLAVRQTVVTSGVEETLRKHGYYSLPKYQAPGERGYDSEIFPAPPRASFFSRGKWAVGWAGGPMIRRHHDSYPPAYSIGFSNGGNEFILNNLYEMVKALKAPVGVRFERVKVPETPVGHFSEPHVNTEFPVLETNLSIWAITTDGLVAGNLRQARFQTDDMCLDGGSAEIVFERPLKGRIYGVFASSAPIDPALAKITTNNKTFLEEGNSLNGEEYRMTYREEASVDIDGDGVADLRVLLSTDMGAYHDFNVYAFLVNEDGQWRILSVYDLVTCT
jgi:hypothetical protein